MMIKTTSRCTQIIQAILYNSISFLHSAQRQFGISQTHPTNSDARANQMDCRIGMELFAIEQENVFWIRQRVE